MTSQELKQAIEEKKNLIATIQNKMADLQGKQDKERPEEKSEDDIQEMQYRSAATSLMEKDPTKAMELLNKAEVIREKKKENDPETIRFKIASNLNTVNGLLQKMDPADPERKWNITLKTELEKQLGSDSPSLQLAYTNAVAEYNKVQNVKGEPGSVEIPLPATSSTPVVTTGSQFSNYNDAISTINSELGKIKTQGPGLTDAIKLLRQRVNASELTIDKTKRDLLLGELDTQEKNKPKARSAVNIEKNVDELFAAPSSQPVPAAYARYDKALNAYNAAKAAFDSGAIGASIGNFLYSLRPEAVNEGDIDLAKSAVRDKNQQALKAVLDKVGVGNLLTTDYKSLAKQLSNAAYSKLIGDRKTNSDQIVELLNTLDATKVRNRALTYYKNPESLTGSGEASPTDNEYMLVSLSAAISTLKDANGKPIVNGKIYTMKDTNKKFKAVIDKTGLTFESVN